jgi:hypothetical protein
MPGVFPVGALPIIGVYDSGNQVNSGHVLLGAADDPQRTVPAGPLV